MTPDLVEKIFQTDFDSNALRSAFSCFPSGVTALCAEVEGKPVGMVASSFTAVSLEPPLVSVCIQNNSTTWPVLRQASSLGVSVLGSEQERVCRKLSAKGDDRFLDLDWQASSTGAIFIAASVLDIECSIHDVFIAGDHQIVVLRLLAFCINACTEPMVFHRRKFRRMAFEDQ